MRNCAISDQFSVVVLSFLVILCSSHNAFAANGAKVLGSGAVSPVLGGTGVAHPQDTGSMVANPAAVTKIGNRVDAASELALIDLGIDTSGAAGANFRNTAGFHKSEVRHMFVPHSGFSMRYKDTDWYYGFTASVVAGLKAEFKKSRISAAITNNRYDKSIELTNVEFIPTLGYRAFDKLSIGLSPVCTFNRFASNQANSNFQETVGGHDGSHSWGIGFNVGGIYDINDYAALAFSYRSPRWNQDFSEYEDTVKTLNGPPEYIFGIAIKPINNLVFEYNMKFIEWTWVDRMEKSGDHDGFGWDDQWVFGFGLQYEIYDRVRLRLGYNYGQSPIRPDDMYANILTPLVSEHHLGVGLGVDVTDNLIFDFGWVHAFENKVEDNGWGDAYSVGGKGSYGVLTVDSLYFGVSYKFD